MGWIEKPHLCDMPLIVHTSVGKVGQWYECDRCYKEWQVQARVLLKDGINYGLTYVRREGDIIKTISWQEPT